MAAPKVIKWGDIRPGDFVALNLMSQLVRVDDVRRNRFGTIYLNHGFAFHGENAPALLLHRPWPEGKTEDDMRDAVRAQALRTAHVLSTKSDSPNRPFVDFEEEIQKLREAIEAYELGKVGEARG